MSIFFRISFPVLVVLVLFSCAVQEAPSGGPEDAVKPTVLSVRPEPLSVNIPLDSEFHIFFSKSMNREKTVGAVFLSPVFWDYPEYKWKGKELIVKPPENLEGNKTYVLTIGADATGHHGNQMGTSYSFAFSTGDAIDSGSISGSIYLGRERPSAFDIWVYSYPDPDSELFLMDIPHYATQVDSMNQFQVTNISSGRYIVLVVDDRNDDLFWDPTSESIGLPPTIVSLDGGEGFRGMTLRPERRDTVLAEFSRVRPIDNRKILVEFSQPVTEELKLDTTLYFIMASDTTFLGIGGAYIGSEGKLVVETQAQEAEKTYRLMPGGLISLWGNSFDSSGTRFTGSAESDTTGPDLLRSDPSGGSRTAYQNNEIELIFTERIRARGFADAVIVVADSVDTLNYAPKWLHPNNVHLLFRNGIPREKEIEITLNEQEIYDIAGNSMGDSVLSFSFRIVPEDTVGSVTVSTAETGNLIGELSSEKTGVEIYTIHADKDGIFSFETVMPGKYYFRYFDDADSNGVWTPGNVKPFVPSEWFYYYRDSINVRSRWTTDLGRID